MKNLLFSALAFVAFAGSGFASNEIVSDFLAITVEKSEIVNQVVDSSEDAIMSGVCHTYTYGYYRVVSLEPSKSPDLSQKDNVIVTMQYVITGQCERCLLMGHDGVVTTENCWGTGF